MPSVDNPRFERELELQAALAELFNTDKTVQNLAILFLTPIYGGLPDLAKGDTEMGWIPAFLKLLEAVRLVDGYFGTSNITKIYASVVIDQIVMVFNQFGTNEEALRSVYQAFLNYNEN